MLEITESAVDVIKTVREENQLPDSAALRIELVQEQEQEGIGFSFTGGPQEGDQTVAEGDDLTVYLAQELSDPLSGAILDAREIEGSVQLELRDREGKGHDHDHDHEGHEH
ncbi:MAG: hypothetical protein ACRDI0_05580 [Actinomycetota bacterium]